MKINSDWHIHTEYSYDAADTLEFIAEETKREGLLRFGITDHVNFNDESFLGDLYRSAEAVNKMKESCPAIILGVELTPIELPEFEHIAKTGTREGYLPPIQSSPYAMELAVTKEELIRLGVKYAIGASHWRVDSPYSSEDDSDREACIREWYRQQLWLAADERVTVLGHPWFHGKSLWYEDFNVIPRSMKEELSAALLENKKYVELNAHFYRCPDASEKFKYQYAEYMREMFEMGIPVTYGSDSHSEYHDQRDLAESYLVAAGFKDGDITEISESDFWC